MGTVGRRTPLKKETETVSYDESGNLLSTIDEQNGGTDLEEQKHSQILLQIDRPLPENVIFDIFATNFLPVISSERCFENFRRLHLQESFH